MGAPLSSSGMPRGHCESIVWTQYSITSRDLVLSRLLSLSALQLSILRAQIRNRAAVRRTSRLNSPVGPGGKGSQQPRLSSVITRCGPNRCCQQPEDGALLIKKGPLQSRTIVAGALRSSTTTSGRPRMEILAKQPPQEPQVPTSPSEGHRSDGSLRRRAPPPR